MSDNPRYTFNNDPSKQLRDVIVITQSDLLAQAWLAEMASVGCDVRGQRAWANALRMDAARIRAEAVNY